MDFNKNIKDFIEYGSENEPQTLMEYILMIRLTMPVLVYFGVSTLAIRERGTSARLININGVTQE